MKNAIICTFIIVIPLLMFGSPDEIVLRDVTHQHDHSGIPIPAEQPDVFIDIDEQEIIIDGLGVVSYYDVEIASASTWYVLISTQVDGDYDTIDISSLPDDYYSITIETPNGNTYEGFFYNY